VQIQVCRCRYRVAEVQMRWRVEQVRVVGAEQVQSRCRAGAEQVQSWMVVSAGNRAEAAEEGRGLRRRGSLSGWS
jgi:hypothetical protein